MGESLEYPDIVQEVRGALNPGRLKLQSTGVIFKNIKTGKVDQFQTTDLKSLNWLHRARGHCLKIILNNGHIHRFDGFKEADFEKLSPFVAKNFNVSLDKVDLSVRGWNWGVANFVGDALLFEVNDKATFEIPLNNVSHSNTAKNEVAIEFHPNDDASVSLMELRFHIPTDNTEKDSVAEFNKNVLSCADIIQATGESIATFTEVQCLTPRGRYDIKIYPSFLQLHGKTFDYKIPYTTVLRLFLLPHKDGRQMFFVVSLDPPIKQGNTRYPYLILLFNKEEEATLELSLTKEEIAERYDGKLNPEMTGPLYEIISRIMKAVVNRKITVPGSFIGHSGTHAISCFYKAATGFLYPLERGFLFVHKPPLHIRFDEITNVNFARSSGATTKSFDFEVETRSGNTFVFNSIEKDEYTKLYDFVEQKNLLVKNKGGKSGKAGLMDQEDMVDSDDEDEHDAYLERMKAEGKARDDDDDDEDSDESTDEDFKPGESGSDVADEYDSNVGSTDSEAGSGDSTSEKKKKKKEKKRSKSESPKKKKEKSTKSSKKEKKDPNAPKKPMSGYFIWLNENREKIKAKNPGISVIDVSKKAGELWRQISDKSEWEQKAKEAKERYKEAMAEYERSGKGRSAEVPSSKNQSKSSPKKSSSDTKAGSGLGYKSKEYLSSSDSASDDEPKKKKKKSQKDKKPKKEEKTEEEESASEKELELPSDEEILSSPEHSDSENSVSD